MKTSRMKSAWLHQDRLFRRVCYDSKGGNGFKLKQEIYTEYKGKCSLQ